MMSLDTACILGTVLFVALIGILYLVLRRIPIVPIDQSWHDNLHARLVRGNMHGPVQLIVERNGQFFFRAHQKDTDEPWDFRDLAKSSGLELTADSVSWNESPPFTGRLRRHTLYFDPQTGEVLNVQLQWLY